MNQAEIQLGDLMIPWILAIGPIGFLLAWLLAGLVALATFFLWIAIVAKAALGEAYELPFVGERAANLANR